MYYRSGTVNVTLITTLSVALRIGADTNIDGTRHVVQWCASTVVASVMVDILPPRILCKTKETSVLRTYVLLQVQAR